MVEIDIPLVLGASLEIDPRRVADHAYPTTRLQKGLALIQEGFSLAEEGVGFGLPVIKCGNRTIFPGHMDLEVKTVGKSWVVIAHYSMDLEERVALPGKGSIENRLVYQIKNSLAGFHRRFPASRRSLTAISNGLRRLMRMETIFGEVASYGTIGVLITIHADLGRVFFDFDSSRLQKENLTEIVVMNEQGARSFDMYQDSRGLYLRGDEIGTWDEVIAEEASFISVKHHLSFTLRQVEGARLFRGREHIGSRLAWSGFGYSLPANEEKFCYEVRLRRYP
jgi:hypothetical protein